MTRSLLHDAKYITRSLLHKNKNKIRRKKGSMAVEIFEIAYVEFYGVWYIFVIHVTARSLFTSLFIFAENNKSCRKFRNRLASTMLMMLKYSSNSISTPIFYSFVIILCYSANGSIFQKIDAATSLLIPLF